MINWEDKVSVSVKTLYGLEAMLVEELKALDIEEIEQGNRVVHFKGSLENVYRACLETRLALRVLINIADFKAETPEDLYDRVYDIAWENIFTTDDTFAIDNTVHSSLFTHGQYASLKMKDALVDRFRDKLGIRPSVDVEEPDYRFNLHISEKFVNISLDASGDSLYKKRLSYRFC